MFVHYIDLLWISNTFLCSCGLFFPLRVMFLCCGCGVKETADSWSGRREKPREVEPAAQSESLSATGFSFPLPLLSVCFVSSFVLLCLDSERVHAARHVIALLQAAVSGNQGLFSSQLLYPIQDVYSYTARGIIPVRRHVYVEYRALGCYQWGPVCVWEQTRRRLFCLVQARWGSCGRSC